jgi:hypothetical protein
VEAEASYRAAHGNLDVGAVATYGLHHSAALCGAHNVSSH